MAQLTSAQVDAIADVNPSNGIVESDPSPNGLHIIPIPDIWDTEISNYNSLHIKSYDVYVCRNKNSDIFELKINIYEYFTFPNSNATEFDIYKSKLFPFIDDDNIALNIENRFLQIDNNINVDNILIITRNQVINSQLIELMTNYCAIIFINYNHKITNLPSNIKYIHILGTYNYDLNSLHNGLLYLHIHTFDNPFTADFDNLPHTIMILRFTECNLVKKINYYPESLIELQLDKYNHSIDNLPDGLRYFTVSGEHGLISNLPKHLVYFYSSANIEYNIISPFHNGLKLFGFAGSGDIKSIHINNLPHSVIKIIIDKEDLFDIKYPPNLKSLYCLEYGVVNFNSIPEGIENLQVSENFIGLIIPEKLPNSLKTFLILYNDYRYGGFYRENVGGLPESEFESECEAQLSEDEADEAKLEAKLEARKAGGFFNTKFESSDEDEEHPRKKTRLRIKIETLEKYLDNKGITIIDANL